MTAAPGVEHLRADALPERFEDVEELELFMSTPTRECVADLAQVDGDVLLLGATGKLGLTLAWLIKRAAPHKRIVGVARFSDPSTRTWLEDRGVEAITADLGDRDQVGALPKLANVIFLAGRKFDSRGAEPEMWATNVLIPALVAETFATSRIVALSSILVYPWSNPLHGGADETVPVNPAPGEYAASVVGRERAFQFHSRRNGTAGRLVRYCYSVDPRYGALQEIAGWVHTGTPIPLETGAINIMWQGDALNQFARLLRHCETPASPINIGLPQAVSVRAVAHGFGRIFGREPIFTGSEQDCLTFNCEAAAKLLGPPVVPLNAMMEWIADWVAGGKPLLGKPSKFEVRGGRF